MTYNVIRIFEISHGITRQLYNESLEKLHTLDRRQTISMYFIIDRVAIACVNVTDRPVKFIV